jgi:DNA polymerase III subunit epsilon
LFNRSILLNNCSIVNYIFLYHRMIPSHLTFVDVETTGMSPQYDRVIEVGIIRVENNEIVAQYNKLLNPETYIHPSIQTLTGISSAELEHAPTFAEEKDTIYELLQDTVFVAHNVRFDYAFLKSEFSRFEMPFTSKQLCTAKLSRMLFPEFRRHGLTAIIERFGFSCEHRHRAYDDAHVLWQFYQRIIDEVQPEKVINAVTSILKRPSLPPNISPELVASLPHTPGVYQFFDEHKTLLYIGKAIDIKARVLSHFTNDHSSTKELSMSRQIADITVIPTAGELGALIVESRLVKELQPLYNRQLRHARQLVVLKKTQTIEGFDTVTCETVTDIHALELDQIMGMFKSKKQASKFLEFVAEKYSLCKKILGVEHCSSSCFGYHLGTCKGACRGGEIPVKYNMRFLLAFAENKIKPWYFDKPVEIVETCRTTGNRERFVLDKWCILRREKSNDEYSVQPEDEDVPPNPKDIDQEYIFDVDTYKIIVRYLDHYYFKNRTKSGINVSIKTI